jgi:hypothetical protein
MLGRMILRRMLLEVKALAKGVVSLPSMPALCKPGVGTSVGVGVDLIRKAIPVGSLVKGVACAYLDAVRAGDSRKVSEARGKLYSAFAEGVGSGLDPNYHIDPYYRAKFLRDEDLNIFFLAGQSFAHSLSPVERYQLSVNLVELHRTSVYNGLYDQTLSAFRRHFNGSIFSEHIKYLLQYQEFSVND